MPWVRIDDHFNEHPKLAGAGPLAWALWLAGLAYCNRNLTDGFIPWSTAGSLVAWEFLDSSGPSKIYVGTDTMVSDDGEVTSAYVIALLVEAGIWDKAPGGYRVHDYEDYQPTKAQVIAEREAKVAAGRAGGLAAARAAGRAGATAERQQNSSTTPSRTAAEGLAKRQPVPNPNPVPKDGSTRPSTSTTGAVRGPVYPLEKAG